MPKVYTDENRKKEKNKTNDEQKKDWKEIWMNERKKRKRMRKNRRIKRNVYLSFLTRKFHTHRRIAKLMIFTTLHFVNKTISFIHSHIHPPTDAHTQHKSEKTNWQESNVVHLAILFCVCVCAFAP